MPIKWCHNAKTGEIFDYKVDGELTDFPRGILLAYDDYLTTGIESKENAEKWGKEYGCCDKCRSSRKPDDKGNCHFCGEEVKFVPINC